MLKVDHLEHLESLVFYGEPGAKKALDILKNIDNYDVTVKYDGSPSLIFGLDIACKFFLATKSIFNKTPKINYSFEDIDKNHGTNPGLVEKLKYVFPFLESACMQRFRNIHQSFIVQGDLMFTDGDLSFDGDKYCFKQNLIEYQFGILGMDPKKVGIALHTTYIMSESGEIIMTPEIPITNFRDLGHHPDIFIFYDIAARKHGQMYGFNTFISQIEDYMLNTIEYNSVSTFEATTAVNRVVRNGNRINVNHVMAEMPAWVDRKLIILHQMFHDAKQCLIRDLHSSSYDIVADIGHEGYVVALPNGEKIKLVKREIFSFKNFETYISPRKV